MVGETDSRNPVEVLGEEFLERRRRGEAASISDYASAYPELSKDIQRLFPAMIALEQFKTCNLSSCGEVVPSQFDGLERLGDYRIIREIGRGGMGVVFQAEQESLRRQVALKVFPRQMLDEARRLERFHREARTAANLHHTNIVPVFGVGHQDGLHYFVMQRIEGTALDDVLGDKTHPTQPCEGSDGETLPAMASTSTDVDSGFDLRTESKGDRPPRGRGRHPSIPGRSAGGRAEWHWVAYLGIQVAEALAYAHSQGVLHRDIKPGNLLLDLKGRVWVTDFGLATILRGDQRANADDVAGTLRFMAPEQLSGEPDARSDVYSLGLTLYELATWRPAFDESNRSKLVEKIIKGEVARPRTVRREIPLDLEAIIQKAIAPDRNARYQEAQELALDLRRFIERRPVRARPLTTIGRVRRWSRRNPAIASLTATLLLLGVVSLGVISAKWRDAVAANQRAENNLSLALDSLDRILVRFTLGWMAHPVAVESEDGVSTGTDTEFQFAVSDYSVAVLEDAVKFYDEFAIQNTASPRLRRETAKVHRRVGDIYERLGQYAKAEKAYERSLSILELEQPNDDAELALESAGTRNQLGRAMYARSRFSAAEDEFHAAKVILSVKSLSQNDDCQAELARTYSNLGQTLALMLEPREASESHQRAIALLEKLVEQHPENIGYRISLARAYRIYFPSLRFSRSNGERERIRSAGIAILEQLVRDFPSVPDYQCELSEMLVTTSGRSRSFGNIDAQIAQLERAVEMAGQIAETHPSISRYQLALARAHRELGEALSRTRADEAEAHFSQAAARYRALASEFSDTPVYHLFLAMVLKDHAESLGRLDRFDEAIAAAEEGIAAQKTFVSLRPDSPFGTSVLGRLHHELASFFTEMQLPEEAEQARQEAERLREQSGPRFGGRHADDQRDQ